MRRAAVLLALLLLPSAALAATAKVEVTRFHLLTPPAPAINGARMAIEPAQMVNPMTPPAPATLQNDALSAAALAALARAGFKPMAAGQPADYVARIALTGQSEIVQRRSPISIGVGGSSGGRNGGIGGGLSFPIGGGARTVTVALLTMQIRRVSDNSAVWEGRATAPAPTTDPMSAAPALLEGLLRGFPGPNGQSVKLKVQIPQ